eukprot:7058520-Pyramimonas_sp.AAC.1
MLYALFCVLELVVGGLFWLAPECKTWINMSRGHTRRDDDNMDGDIRRRGVVEANFTVPFVHRSQLS